MSVKRIYVEKKENFAIRAKELYAEIKHYLHIEHVEKVRVLIRYDVENVSENIWNESIATIFSEPPLDIYFETTFPHLPTHHVFSVEYLPGQFDQRADSAIQCLKLLGENKSPIIKSAITYCIEGEISEEEFLKIKSYCINPVDSRIAIEEIPSSLEDVFDVPKDVEILSGFRELGEEALHTLYTSLSLAMTFKDFLHIQTYFLNEEGRDPFLTEIRVLDTYWSDHCRHTTFSTELTSIEFEEGYLTKPIKESYEKYIRDRKILYKDRNDKYICLMDIALLAMKKLKADRILTDVEESEEINACSIVVPVEVDGKVEEWLVNFKNETHNHPTEIEPFGGAATCLGGAIRDPLSGRTYVYQAMRITGAADPTKPLEETLEGKLPQRKIVTGAAHGYSSYGNQIGLATGYVKEIYHPGYVAKRMEIGAVMGAAKREYVIRKTSDPGDVIVLLGGRTGRDGIGGATGSSKVHQTDSITTAGAEVQKGNPPTERKIQRLFRRPEVSLLIKKCNDFGAGGVSVAIGELAEGLDIDLDKVPKKYAGLDGTELSISESQERMAVVLDPKDVVAFLSYAQSENIEATIVATVRDTGRLVMTWRGKKIVDLSRKFLDTNGAKQEASAYVHVPDEKEIPFHISSYDEKKSIRENWLEHVADINVASQKGLVEMFDSSIGAGSVLMPYGGIYQMSETQSMVAKLPLDRGETHAVSVMSYGFDPYISSWSPYHGAIYAITSSISKIVAAGGDYEKIHFTFQEYFRRMTNDPSGWSEPVAALLGAYEAQMRFGLASIGGKDSMSGTFNNLHVPPTLVSFAVAMADARNILSPEFKSAGNAVMLLELKKDAYGIFDYDALKVDFKKLQKDIADKKIVSAYVVERAGIVEALTKMSLGNRLGIELNATLDIKTLFEANIGDIVVEVVEGSTLESSLRAIGSVTKIPYISYKEEKIEITEIEKTWVAPLESVFPSVVKDKKIVELKDTIYTADKKHIYIGNKDLAKPTVFIPVMPGTNCEYDSLRAFERAGARVEVGVFRNLDEVAIRESICLYKEKIKQSQILMFPGGFSAGDEPEGSAKFFAAVFRNDDLHTEVDRLLHDRDGLVLGICNGFQTLIKLGLLPDAQIKVQEENSPTLAMNENGRHISKMVYLKVVSDKSPWLGRAKIGGIYANPASHGEGRFVADAKWIEKLFENGQVVTRYVDDTGHPTMDSHWNPNGSYAAIEGITSADGRVLGKMAHSERRGAYVAINITGEQDMQIFESGVEYFA